MSTNYFNTLSLKLKLEELGTCRFMQESEFSNGISSVKNLKIVIVGCGAQGLNQGLNMRDSGLDISYALRENAILEKRQSFINASENKKSETAKPKKRCCFNFGFKVIAHPCQLISKITIR